jgi:hypothetical protein
LEGLPK